MKAIKALVVEYDEKTRQAIDEILTTLGHKYDTASSLAEAMQLLAVNTYTYVLLGHEVPARPGSVPRRQNAENFMDAWTHLSDDRRPPVILLFSPMPDVEEEDKLRWAADMRTRGATAFVCKPFKTAGRTLDRVIKKLLAGQTECIRMVSIPLVPITNPGVTAAAGKVVSSSAAPSQGPLPAPSVRTGQPLDGNGDWLSVTQAARLLMHDLPSLNLSKARSRISTAASRDDFRSTGSRKNRRIEPHSFASWRLKQRDGDLDEEEDDDEP